MIINSYYSIMKTIIILFYVLLFLINNDKSYFVLWKRCITFICIVILVTNSNTSSAWLDSIIEAFLAQNFNYLSFLSYSTDRSQWLLQQCRAGSPEDVDQGELFLPEEISQAQVAILLLVWERDQRTTTTGWLVSGWADWWVHGWMVVMESGEIACVCSR